MATNLYSSRTSNDAQIRRITEDISEIFIKDSKDLISLDFNNFIQKIEQISLKLEMVVKSYTPSSGKIESIKTLKRASIKKRQLMLEGYLLIQNFRALLTGSLVDYRYYTEDKNGHVQMVSLTEEELLKYLKISTSHGIETGFALSGQLNTLSKNIEHSVQEELFLEHFDNLYNSIMTEDMTPGWTYGYRVHGFIIDKYGNREQKTPTNLFNQKSGRFQQFNKGHIFEGLDISMFEAGADMSNDKLYYNYNLIKQYFYTKNLAYDSVKGFKGGDNTFTNTQIKSTGADLVDFKTIISQIEELKNALFNSNNEKELKEKLTNIFIDTTGKAIEDEIDDIVVNNLFKDIKNFYG